MAGGVDRAVVWTGAVSAVLAFAIAVAQASAQPPPQAPTAGEALPWELWLDPVSLPRLPAGVRPGLRSSYCPEGCQQDRNDAERPRFLRLDGAESVIFEDPGAGAIVRLWMTTGRDGASAPLDPAVRLRVYLDGAEEPVVDLPLPDVFAGSEPPFLTPLVGDRRVSSGGYFSYVPIPYRRGCRVTLLGGEDYRLWYQLTFVRSNDATGIESFSGDEDLSRWHELLSTAPGADPWVEPEAVEARGRRTLAADEEATLFALDGPGLITGWRLAASAKRLADLEVRLRFDGRTTVRLPASDFFAVGRIEGAPSRSLLLGRDAVGRLYCFFPMPFSRRGEIYLRNTGKAPIDVAHWVRTSARPPAPDAGVFGAQRYTREVTSPGVEHWLLGLTGAGKWVGLWAELGSVETRSRTYLEGDERVYLGRSRQPDLHGTGVEDFFGGGFYFDHGPFRQALHGSSYHLRLASFEDATAAYRLLLPDAVPFDDGIRAVLETGPTGELRIRARTVAYYYRRP